MERCIICNKAQDAGIHLYTSFICTSCEQEIIQTEVDDPKYKYFVEQMRVIKETKIVT